MVLIMTSWHLLHFLLCIDWFGLSRQPLFVYFTLSICRGAGGGTQINNQPNNSANHYPSKQFIKPPSIYQANQPTNQPTSQYIEPQSNQPSNQLSNHYQTYTNQSIKSINQFNQNTNTLNKILSNHHSIYKRKH